VAFFEDNYPEARRFLEDALRNGSPDGAVNISYAEVLIAMAEKNSEPSLLNTAHGVLDAYLNLIHDYEQETLIEDARVLALQQRYTEAAKRIERMLDVDPEQTDLHVHDWAVYRGRASWGLLLDSLKKTASDLTASPRLSAALGLALYRGREKLEGAQNIRTALQQSPQDPLLLALAGWVETKLGQTESGAVYIKQAATLSDKYKLPHILAARLCESRSDWDCAKSEWNKVLALDGRSAEALHGLAYVVWHQSKDRAQASALLTQLYANDPYYIPYLELQQEISDSSRKIFGGGDK
jgi:tetratricopeptide (TPR) repeat protein